ncbi:unnamed protein product [Rotaria magnacalcarata]|uniref:Bridge-like lipid transfer protein family member 1 C-terminal domain-containing protein n=1 Tax=Rotaria magnacalcarata TaxID=392030 RepID=A0A8S2PBN7_9BILA|nr:unnamed protein product [Rotaria magnacalcarata]
MPAAAVSPSYSSNRQRISEMIPLQFQAPSSTIYEEAHESTASLTPTITARTSSDNPDEAQSNSSPSLSSPNEITSTPAVDFELNLQIEISSGSCNLFTRRDLIAHSPLTNNLSKQQKQATLGLIQIINKIEYQVSQFSLPGFDVNANYNTKHANLTNKSLNKRASFYCRAMIQSPATQIIIHPILLDFLEQTLEYVKLPREQQRRSSIRDEHTQDQNSDNDHLDNIFLIEDQTSSTSIPIDVVVSIFIQPCVLLFTCLPTHPMECLIRQDFRDRSLLVDASHVMNILTDAIEIRIDYMGSPTLMGRICHILLQLNDDRHTETETNAMPASTLVVLNLRWSQLHLMITRSTTPDILKMAMKLTEFVNAQIANSKNLLASIQYDFSTDQKNIRMKKSSNVPAKYDISVIKKHVGMNGGEIMLQGHNLTIVVFHGLNFKSRQWALFSLNEPQINFVTDRGEEGDINQKLFFYLDHQSQTTFSSSKSRSNIASISRVTRNSNEPPAHLTINEWFNYASSTISAVGLRDFPTMGEPETPATASSLRSRQYELNAESIFILPALELRFQTRQLNGQVHCSFETEFYEHIMFTFNAEHFYFLHDLISSYIKEKERTAAVTVNNDKTRQRLTTTSSTSSDNQIPPPLDELRSDDIRRFICPDSKWKLQPTVKLLTAYGNEVEPFGADYILQKLGFHHARLTIPKWVQRGIMDPCEQSMTIVQLILIFLLPERFKELRMKQ